MEAIVEEFNSRTLSLRGTTTEERLCPDCRRNMVSATQLQSFLHLLPAADQGWLAKPAVSTHGKSELHNNAVRDGMFHGLGVLSAVAFAGGLAVGFTIELFLAACVAGLAAGFRSYFRAQEIAAAADQRSLESQSVRARTQVERSRIYGTLSFCLDCRSVSDASGRTVEFAQLEEILNGSLDVQSSRPSELRDLKRAA